MCSKGQSGDSGEPPVSFRGESRKIRGTGGPRALASIKQSRLLIGELTLAVAGGGTQRRECERKVPEGSDERTDREGQRQS